MFGDEHPNCKTLEDFLRKYRLEKYDNKMRKLVEGLCNKVFGKECTGAIEVMVMKRLKLEYKDILTDGTKPKTRRAFGSVRRIVSRLRQTYFVERLR